MALSESGQVLPTTLRGQGMAFFNVMSMFSQMASPVVVYSVSQEDVGWKLTLGAF